MMIKEFFTLGEAASYISPPDGVALTIKDLYGFCEDGRLPISFKYRGMLGYFLAYSKTKVTTEILFPMPIQAVYFDGYLSSSNPCRIADVITTYRSLGPGRGRQESTEVRNTLCPNKVEILKTIHIDQMLGDGDVGAGFWGRLKDADGGLDRFSFVPETEWVVHVSHLKKIESRPDPAVLVLPRPCLQPPPAISQTATPSTLRLKPMGGDSLSPLVWKICSDLRDCGERISPRSVMAELKSLATGPNKCHPLLGQVTGGVKFEYEYGIEDELNIENLRHRIRK